MIGKNVSCVWDRSYVMHPLAGWGRREGVECTLKRTDITGTRFLPQTHCAAVTPCNRNLQRSASLPRSDKTDRRQQAFLCPIRAALRPDPNLLRNSHSSTPQVSLSLSTTSNICAHKHTATEQTLSAFPHMNSQISSQRRWQVSKELIVSLNALIMLISTDQGA